MSVQGRPIAIFFGSFLIHFPYLLLTRDAHQPANRNPVGVFGALLAFYAVEVV